MNPPQIKAMFTQLQENQRQMNDAVNSCKVALETEDIGAVSDYSLKLCPDFREVKTQLEELNVSNLLSLFSRASITSLGHSLSLSRNRNRTLQQR